jgi:hypothetical protein
MLAEWMDSKVNQKDSNLTEMALYKYWLLQKYLDNKTILYELSESELETKEKSKKMNTQIKILKTLQKDNEDIDWSELDKELDQEIEKVEED